MVFTKVVLKNKSGLHARPASLLVELANKYKSEIMIKKKNMIINAKSIMGVMTLGASKGTEIEIEIEGSDEKEALEAILELVHNNFNEE